MFTPFTFQQPQLVTSGLVLYLDAADRTSYPAYGTTWKDLSGVNNGTLTNGPTYNSSNGGSIVFDGTNDYITGSLSNLPIGNADRTVSGWFRTTRVLATAQYQSVFWYGNLSTNNGFFYAVGGDANIGGVGAANRFGGSNYGDGLGSPQTVNDGLWKNGVITINNSVWTLYLNGVNVASKTLITDTSNTTYRLGYDGLTFYYQGNIANITVYNRALSAAEVTQNFNAQRQRFNI
jgi:hypothetical protein